MTKMSHLLHHDILLMQEFLDAYPTRYTSIEFDVHVGQGRDPGQGFDSNIRSMAIRLSQRRIDAVGFLPGRIEIIEVTQVADLKALGQLQAYPQLYQQTFKPSVPLTQILVARQFGTDVEQVYAQANIESFLFPG